LLSQVTKAALELGLAEGLTGHLGYEKHDPAGRGSGNSRYGSTGNRADRCRRGGPGVSLGRHRLLAAEILGGQLADIRIEPVTLMFYDPESRTLLRTRPNLSEMCRTSVVGSQSGKAQRQGQGRRQAGSGAAELGHTTRPGSRAGRNSNDVASSIEWPSS
jgi:hypothetical protein